MTADDVRARAIEAGADAMEEYGLGLYGSEQRAVAAAMVDAVEPIIRADERGRVAAARALAWALNLPPEDDNGAGDWP